MGQGAVRQYLLARADVPSRIRVTKQRAGSSEGDRQVQHRCKRRHERNVRRKPRRHARSRGRARRVANRCIQLCPARRRDGIHLQMDSASYCWAAPMLDRSAVMLE